MGTVWRAYDEVLDREVAVKEVRLPARASEGERRVLCRRLVEEARATAALTHPGVVAVHDVVVEDGRPWIVMELVHARSLFQVVAEDGPLTPARAARVGREVLAVLRAAHGAGIAHRDVKPGNVLLCADGRVLLTDFGLAVHLDDDGDIADTLAPGIQGSPAYLAPERVRGDPGGEAADMWALGATLYAAVEGAPPFLRPHALASMLAVLMEEFEPPRDAGVLGPVIVGLLRPDPAERLTAAETARMLDALIDDDDDAQDDGGGARRPPREGRRHPRIGAFASVAAFAGAVVVLGAWTARWNAVGQSDAATLVPVAGAVERTVDYRVPGGYSVDVPADWRRTERDGTVQWDDPDAPQRLRIAPAPGDALGGLRSAERTAEDGGLYAGYHRLRLERTPDLAGGAAEWEFTYRGLPGTPELHGLHSRAGGYELSFSAPDARWTPGQRLYDKILGSFRPEGH
ncbi:protein kinase [Actinomadura sp. PM05-2]|uniref:non-specific serine/threonine protein kinase n=1 Tax=Actinomadura parmotrematis TaxID=2864039 RepID=A0ABS7FRK5_9ACTN|nr:protein kinase [Actinomadura parmotrematis]